MTPNAIPEAWDPSLEPLDEEVDHVRGSAGGRLIIEYGDYECPYSRLAFREIERVEQELRGRICFSYRHFPLVQIHPHAFAAAAAAEAAAIQNRFSDMHELLFHRQKALEDADLRRYAAQLELDVARFDDDRNGTAILERIRRDVESGTASAQVCGTLGNLTDLREETADERIALVSDDGARFELRCAACGYGVVVRIAPDTCPMCKGTVWEHVAPMPSGDDSQREAGRPR